MVEPRCHVMTLLDEPQGLAETYGLIDAGWNAAVVPGKVIEQTAPLLGVERHAAEPSIKGKTDMRATEPG
jgi:hypothetical protein